MDQVTTQPMDKTQAMLHRMAQVQIEESVRKLVSLHVTRDMNNLFAADQLSKGKTVLDRTGYHCQGTSSWFALDHTARADIGVLSRMSPGATLIAHHRMMPLQAGQFMTNDEIAAQIAALKPTLH